MEGYLLNLKQLINGYNAEENDSTPIVVTINCHYSLREAWASWSLPHPCGAVGCSDNHSRWEFMSAWLCHVHNTPVVCTSLCPLALAFSLSCLAPCSLSSGGADNWCPLDMDVPWIRMSLGCIQMWREHCTIIYSRHSGQLWVSAFSIACCSKKLLWGRLSASLIMAI